MISRRALLTVGVTSTSLVAGCLGGSNGDGTASVFSDNVSAPNGGELVAKTPGEFSERHRTITTAMAFEVDDLLAILNEWTALVPHQAGNVQTLVRSTTGPSMTATVNFKGERRIQLRQATMTRPLRVENRNERKRPLDHPPHATDVPV